MKHKTNIKWKNVYYGEGEKLVIVAFTPFTHYSQISLVIYDTLSFVISLQQKVSLYAKWFHWILSEFTSCSEWELVKKLEFIGLMNRD
jgi:hypothetical protein